MKNLFDHLENYFIQDDNGIYHKKGKIVDDSFEKIYLEIRNKEERLISDDILLSLPETEKSYKFHTEWVVRKNSANFLINEIRKLNEFNTLLDIGCGNAWLTNLLTKTFNIHSVGIDLNYSELSQARRVFNNDNLSLLYGDENIELLPPNFFDVIILTSSIQYFKDIKHIINKLLTLLTDLGKIYILDSIFYDKNSLKSAQKSTKEYYDNLGIPKGSNYYYHHTFLDLEGFNYKILRKPTKNQNRFAKKFKKKENSPFHFIIISKYEI